MKKKDEEIVVYSKITGERRPPCDRIRTREPNLELMAKAIINLYESTREGNKHGK